MDILQRKRMEEKKLDGVRRSVKPSQAVAL